VCARGSRVNLRIADSHESVKSLMSVSNVDFSNRLLMSSTRRLAPLDVM
jgi:hypothetical protein